MATYFLDLEAGDDTKDGTTFANRWKTINSGATNARITAGDTIKVMGSPDQTSLGINVTFTNNTNTLTLASALTSLITNCDSAWTASANVTCNTVTSSFLSSTASARMQIAAGFTTGLVAYFATGTINLSAYQGITFGILCNSAPTDGWFEIRLCSDTVGAVAVDTFVVNGVRVANVWERMYIDKGSALGASIQSIAIYATSDPGTMDVSLDNINATKAAGNDCLNLTTLIGKQNGADGWYPIRSINGTTVTLDTYTAAEQALTVNALGWYGTSNTETGYIRKMIRIETTGIFGSIQDVGTAGNLITFSGGWDRTAMTTQNLETYVDSGCSAGTFLQMNTYTKADKLHPVRFQTGFTHGATSHWELGDVSAIMCQIGVTCNGAQDHYIASLTCNGTKNAMVFSSTRMVRVGTLTYRNGTTSTNFSESMLYFGSASDWNSGIRFESIVMRGINALAWSWSQGATIHQFEVWAADLQYMNSSANYAGHADMGLVDYRFGAISCSNNVNNWFFGGGHGVVQSLTLGGGGTTSLGFATYAATNPHFGEHRVLASSVTGTVTFGNGTFQPCDAWAFFRNYNGVANDHRGYYDAGVGAKLFSETGANRHTASGIGWRIDCLQSDYDSTFPIRLKLATLVLENGVASTLRLFVKRSNTGLSARLRVLADEVVGVADTSDTISVIAGTWEELSISVTPAEYDELDVWLEVWGGSTYSLYFDDLTVI